jgi:hypothetical protein
MIQDDLASVFSYDGEGDPDTFSLHELNAAVNSHFSTVCSLEKLAQGGYHKVCYDTPIFSHRCHPHCLQAYDILKNGMSLGVVRVAAPAFPKDKLESEVIGESL